MFSNTLKICPGATTFGLSGTPSSQLEGSDQHFAFGKATQGLPKDSKNKRFNFGFRTNTVHEMIQKRERKGPVWNKESNGQEFILIFNLFLL